MNRAIGPVGALVPTSDVDLDLFKEIKGPNTPMRILAILIKATREGKIAWFRDASWVAVTYIPLLAVS